MLLEAARALLVTGKDSKPALEILDVKISLLADAPDNPVNRAVLHAEKARQQLPRSLLGQPCGCQKIFPVLGSLIEEIHRGDFAGAASALQIGIALRRGQVLVQRARMAEIGIC